MKGITRLRKEWKVRSTQVHSPRIHMVQDPAALSNTRLPYK